MNLAEQEHEELLMELTTTRYWKALKKELSSTLQQYQRKLLQPADSEFALIEKEVVSARYDALERFFRSLEQRVDKFAKQK